MVMGGSVAAARTPSSPAASYNATYPKLRANQRYQLSLKLMQYTDLAPACRKRRLLTIADETQDIAANHSATDEAGEVCDEIIRRSNGGWRAFLPLLDDPQSMMRFQAAVAVRDHGLARVIPVLQDLAENARGLVPSQARMELYPVQRDGRL